MKQTLQERAQAKRERRKLRRLGECVSEAQGQEITRRYWWLCVYNMDYHRQQSYGVEIAPLTTATLLAKLPPRDTRPRIVSSPTRQQRRRQVKADGLVWRDVMGYLRFAKR